MQDSGSAPISTQPRITNLAVLCFSLGVSLIVLPPFFTPLIPYIDNIAFSSMSSFPSKASYGPEHFYVFQFSYILTHMISRIFTDLGLTLRHQLLFFYLVQALSFYSVVSYLLVRFVRNQVVLCFALLFSSLAFNDGVFVWGVLAYT